MGNLDIGPKESTGPTSNETAFVQTFDDPRRFITSYQIKYDQCFLEMKKK